MCRTEMIIREKEGPIFWEQISRTLNVADECCAFIAVRTVSLLLAV